MYLSNFLIYYKILQMYENEKSLRSDSLMSQDESQKIQISVACRNLADLDTFSVTDSFLIIYLQELNKPSRQILKTKVYWNDLNPNYAQPAIIDYFFEIRQKLIFQVYHESSPPVLVGKFQCSVGQVFGSPDNGLLKPLINTKGKQSGKILIRCEKIQKASTRQVTLKIGARGLPSHTFLFFFGGTNPFFRVFRITNKQELLVYQSQHLINTTQPRFKQFTISERRLTKNIENQPFQIRFYDYSDIGNHQYMGTAKVTINQLAQQKTSYPIQKGPKIKGTCILEKIHRFQKYDFGNFIQAGLQLALVTCIDFTASNGSHKSPQSLHYSAGYKISPYAEALTQVSRILLDYDYDKLVPVYGFGAKVRMPNFNSGGKVHHCFPINGNQSNPNLYQVQGILQQYRNCLPYLQFGGPTKFSGLLQQAMIQCKQFQKNHSQYMILFILTDGQIHDKKEVIDQIIACGTLPLSIIIVGIGHGDFEIMKDLDDDDCRLVDSHGQKTKRDLVQFVEFSKFKNNGVQLAREVLEQLPRQVVQYFQLVNLTPQDIPKPQTDIQFQKQLKSMLASHLSPSFGSQPNANNRPPNKLPPIQNYNNNMGGNNFQVPPGMVNPSQINSQSSNPYGFTGNSKMW